VRVRTLAAAAAAILAVAGVAGCRSNVGTAVIVNGHRVSETTVSDYVTPNAVPVKVAADSSGTNTYLAAPRSIVVQTIIDNMLYDEILKASSAGMPSKGQLAQATAQTLAGDTPQKFLTSHNLKGFTNSFAVLFVRRQTLGSILSALEQQGVDLNAALKKIKVDVSVSPRYGKWDKKQLTLLSPNTNAGVPGFISLAPVAGSSGSAQPAAVPTQ
jgi:hypothetical protein